MIAITGHEWVWVGLIGVMCFMLGVLLNEYTHRHDNDPDAEPMPLEHHGVKIIEVPYDQDEEG